MVCRTETDRATMSDPQTWAVRAAEGRPPALPNRCDKGGKLGDSAGAYPTYSMARDRPALVAPGKRRGGNGEPGISFPEGLAGLGRLPLY